MRKFFAPMMTFALCILLSRVTALPKSRAGVTLLTKAQIDAFTPYTYYASAAECTPATTLTWTCGVNCDANPTFKPTATGGDGFDVQYWYVGFDPTLNTVIVGHQATEVEKLLPLLTDIDIALIPLNAKLFPGVPSDLRVHSGFKESHEDTAAVVLTAVKSTLSSNGVNKVVVAGWSLGAAIGLLDGLYLKLQLPSVDVSVVSYGMPRVGNQSWANFVDLKLAGKVTHINNQDDIVPILPGRFLGYKHVSGEDHIQDDGTWVACSGQDNTDARCSTGDVSSIFDGDTGDHDGPYNGIELGC